VLTVVVLLAGVAASFGVGSVVRQSAQRAADRAMDGRTELMTAAVTTEIGRYLDQIRTLTAALGTIDELTAVKFARVTAPLAPLGLSGATSVAFIVPASGRQVAGVQAHWRQRGVTGLTLHPWGTGPHLFAVLSTRLDGQKRITSGRDLAQNPAPRAALDEARRSGSAAVSDTYQFFSDQALPAAQRQHSFVFTAPVYAAVGTATGQRVFRGWMLMGLRGQDFIHGALWRVSQNLVDVTLSARNANGTQTIVAGLTGSTAGARDLHRRAEIPVAQRHWLLRTTAAHAALGGSHTLAGAMTATLLMLTLLLVVLVATLASGRARAQRLVTAATGELRRTEREARDQAQLLTTILDSITDGVDVVDERGKYIVRNPAGKAMLGVDADPAASYDWQRHYGLYRPDGSAPYPVEEMPLVRALHGESPTGVELLVRNPVHPDGVLITVNARQLALADGSFGAVAVFRDVTDDRAHEAELAGFAGVVAHDLKSPLATVVGYGELLEDALRAAMSGPEREQALAHLARIGATAARMRTLIDDLLAYTTARDATIHPTTFALTSLVHEVVSARVDAARADRNAGYFPDIYVGPLPTVHADPVLLRQVVENLVGNALKYTPPGQAARIDITGDTQPGQIGRQMARVEIADRGIGLPAGEHSRIFARFHRAHADAGYPGTGLGLAICQRIIERHGGMIAAADNPGGGARFRFTIPAAPPAEPRNADEPRNAETRAQAAVAPGMASSGRSSSA
jgi:signal transduction histidine kinase